MSDGAAFRDFLSSYVEDLLEVDVKTTEPEAVTLQEEEGALEVGLAGPVMAAVGVQPEKPA